AVKSSRIPSVGNSATTRRPINWNRLAMELEERLLVKMEARNSLRQPPSNSRFRPILRKRANSGIKSGSIATSISESSSSPGRQELDLERPGFIRQPLLRAFRVVPHTKNLGLSLIVRPQWR